MDLRRQRFLKDVETRLSKLTIIERNILEVQFSQKGWSKQVRETLDHPNLARVIITRKGLETKDEAINRLVTGPEEDIKTMNEQTTALIVPIIKKLA